MGEVVDGQYQKYVVESGAYVRETFLGHRSAAARRWSSTCRDDQLEKMRLGGHDPIKVYNAYKAAVEHKGSPTVILAKTIKGYGLGEAAKARTSPTSRRR